MIRDEKPMGMFYVLDGHEVKPTDDIHEWGKMFEDIDGRVVGKSEVGQFTVSTVFLGLDHGVGVGPPQIFETMIFGDVFCNGSDYQTRCSTWREALQMHSMAVDIAKNASNPLVRLFMCATTAWHRFLEKVRRRTGADTRASR